MDDYIERKIVTEYIKIEEVAKALSVLTPYSYNECLNMIVSGIEKGYAETANVHEDVKGTPMLRYRPERYEMYEENGINENGEILYLKRIITDEKSYAMYCSCCGKRLCSRCLDFCPNCGARMGG